MEPSLGFHRTQVSDVHAQECFRRALQETLRGGEVVLDLGTGLGLHALFACEAGARHVYAVEQGSVAHLAREVIRANGQTNKVTVLHGFSDELELPEKVDVLVTNLGLSGLLRFVPAARRRFLKPGGTLIPKAAELHGGPVQAGQVYGEGVSFWDETHYGLDVSPVRRVAESSRHTCALAADDLLAPTQRLARFDLAAVQGESYTCTGTFEMARGGILHGIALWMVEWLTDGLSLATGPAPARPSHPTTPSLLPLSRPVPVRPGDTVAFTLTTAEGTGGEVARWETRVRDAQGGLKAESVQTTLAALSLSADELRRQARDHVPQLTPEGRAARLALAACDGRRLGEIEEAVFREFPELFADAAAAAAFVSRTLARSAR